MNKSLLVLLALAIVSTNLVVAKATNNNEKSCWCWDHCDGKIAKKWCGCEKTEKKVVKVKKAKKNCSSCCNKSL